MKGATDFRSMQCAGLALAGFKPALRLVDYIDAALTAHDAAIAVTLLERTERVSDLHRSSPLSRRGDAPWGYALGTRAENGGRYWDRTSDPFDVNEVLYR